MVNTEKYGGGDGGPEKNPQILKDLQEIKKHMLDKATASPAYIKYTEALSANIDIVRGQVTTLFFEDGGLDNDEMKILNDIANNEETYTEIIGFIKTETNTDHTLIKTQLDKVTEYTTNKSLTLPMPVQILLASLIINSYNLDIGARMTAFKGLGIYQDKQLTDKEIFQLLKKPEASTKDPVDDNPGNDQNPAKSSKSVDLQAAYKKKTTKTTKTGTDKDGNPTTTTEETTTKDNAVGGRVGRNSLVVREIDKENKSTGPNSTQTGKTKTLSATVKNKLLNVDATQSTSKNNITHIPSSDNESTEGKEKAIQDLKEEIAFLKKMGINTDEQNEDLAKLRSGETLNRSVDSVNIRTKSSSYSIKFGGNKDIIPGMPNHKPSDK